MNDMTGHNAPPPFEAITLQVEELLAGASRLEQNHPTCDSDELAEKIGGFKRQLQAAMAACEKSRKEEKEPFLRAGQEVDARWGEYTRKLKQALDLVLVKLTGWGRVKEAKKADEERKAREVQAAKEKELREAEERLAAEKAKAAAGEASRVLETQADADCALVETVRAEDQVERISAPVRFGSGTQVAGTRAVAMQTVYSVEITDTRLAAIYYRNHPAIAEILQKLALPELRLGRVVPGCELKEERKAR